MNKIIIKTLEIPYHLAVIYLAYLKHLRNVAEHPKKCPFWFEESPILIAKSKLIFDSKMAEEFELLNGDSYTKPVIRIELDRAAGRPHLESAGAQKYLKAMNDYWFDIEHGSPEGIPLPKWESFILF